MFTLIKPFLKYDAVLAVALIVYYILNGLEPDKLVINYAIFVYFPILLLAAPIIFGIWYGHKLSDNYTLSIKNIFKISVVIVILSCITYYIPYYEWISRSPTKLYDLHPVAFFPTTLLIITFLCSIFLNRHGMKIVFELKE